VSALTAALARAIAIAENWALCCSITGSDLPAIGVTVTERLDRAPAQAVEHRLGNRRIISDKRHDSAAGSQLKLEPVAATRSSPR